VERRSFHHVIWAALLPLVLVLAYLRTHLGGAESEASARAPGGSGGAVAPCNFPGRGEERQRLVIGIVDSLRAETALDPTVMPWLSHRTQDALWGRMQPCLSQLSLLCFRTMFEGSEPLLVTGFHNFSGMDVQAPSLVHRLATRGVRVAAVADQAFIKLYRPSLAEHAMFEERPAGVGRDEFGRDKTFAWLGDPSLDVIVSHVIDTDGIAHRHGVGPPEYVEKFREADSFLAAVAGRLGPRDSMIVLGDHGHSKEGHHSSGIPAATLFVATGPWFPQGRRVDTSMATTYFLAGAVTCETTPTRYTGQQPFDALTWPASTRDAFRAASPPPVKPSASFDVFLDVSALGAGLCLLALLLGALRGAVTPPMLLAATVGLVAAAVLPGRLVLAITAVGVGAMVFRQRSVERQTALLLALAAGVGLFGGFFAPLSLVHLQNNVNPTWTIGFWAAIALVVVALSFASRRGLGLPTSLTLGFVAWAFILYALFLGPYYYAAFRLLPFGLIALVFGFTAMTPKGGRRALLPWVLSVVLPLIPILFPMMKEWNPRWVLLGFVEGRGPVVTAAAAVGALGLAVALTRELRAWVKPAVGVVLLLAIGIATQLAEWTLLGAVLVMVAYGAWTRLVERVANVHPSGALLVPIGQASFALSLLFVLLGGYRFASVDFRFALALTPVAAGEAQALAIAVPLCIVKYLVPLGLLLWTGPRMDSRAAAFVLLKVLVLGAGLLGMQLSGSPSLALFRQLQSQELGITCLVYVVVTLVCMAWPARVASRDEDRDSAGSPCRSTSTSDTSCVTAPRP